MSPQARVENTLFVSLATKSSRVSGVNLHSQLAEAAYLVLAEKCGFFLLCILVSVSSGIHVHVEMQEHVWTEVLPSRNPAGGVTETLVKRIHFCVKIG